VIDFAVPDLGEGLEDATVSQWQVAVGDQVELNQVLCTVETAKAAVEIPSPVAGRVVELGGAEGDVLPVGAILVRFDPAPSSGGVLVGYGTDAEADRSRRPPQSQRPRTRPSVRKLAAELQVDLNAVAPAENGIITREAVLATAGATAGDAENDSTAVRGVQAEMATRMATSRREIPDAHAGVDVDCTRLLALQERLQISPFVLVLRLLVLALGSHRILNGRWVDGPDGPRVQLHRHVHLGFGVATSRGLLVPVVRDAQTRTTRELAAVVTGLVDAARAGRIAPADLTGSTFTVSNFGPLGLDDGVPVINHPEAAILGMGAIRPRAVVVDGALAVRSTMRLTCAFDHRVADGAQVAAFLVALRELIEEPDLALAEL